MASMRAGAAAAALLAAATLGLTGCGGHGGTTAGHPVSASAAAGGSGTSQAPASMSTVEVERLWERVVDQCSNVDTHISAPEIPQDPYGFGIATAWPTDAQLQTTLTALRPHGTSTFTDNALADLRAAELGIRGRLVAVATNGETEVRNAPAYGNDPNVSIAAASTQVSGFRETWAATRDYLAHAIDTGIAGQPTGKAADGMELAREMRKAWCR